MDFQTNKRVCEEVAIIPSKALKNKIAGYATVRARTPPPRFGRARRTPRRRGTAGPPSRRGADPLAGSRPRARIAGRRARRLRTRLTAPPSRSLSPRST